MKTWGVKHYFWSFSRWGFSSSAGTLTSTEIREKIITTFFFFHTRFEFFLLTWGETRFFWRLALLSVSKILSCFSIRVGARDFPGDFPSGSELAGGLCVRRPISAKWALNISLRDRSRGVLKDFRFHGKSSMWPLGLRQHPVLL